MIFFPSSRVGWKVIGQAYLPCFHTHAGDNDSSNVDYINDDIFGGRDCYNREPSLALTLASPINVS